MEQEQIQSAGETNGEQKPHRWGLSGSTLKLIAVLTMLVDHTGATVLARMLLTQHYVHTAEHVAPIMNYADYNKLYVIYAVMRSIGRIAFPIFCFLLVEGFHKTRNVKKYALRLGCFALLSEIPFDLAFNARVLEFSYQNVFFTLFLGLLTVMAVDWAFVKKKWAENRTVNRLIGLTLSAVFLVAGCLAAHFLKTDYAARGVLCIMALYATSKWKPVQMIVGALSFLWELPAPAAFLPMAFYNGKRGLNLKYVFYAFYPVHLLLLYLICRCIGLAGVAV